MMAPSPAGTRPAVIRLPAFFVGGPRRVTDTRAAPRGLAHPRTKPDLHMCDGYYAAGDDSPEPGLDEFLCEYVDGTMDPSVRAAFEEYLRANPALLEHVNCLRRTRSMLCHYGCQRRAPQGVQARLRGRLGCEVMQSQSPLFTSVTPRLGTFAAFTSAMLVMLFVGLLLGELFFAKAPAAFAEGRSPQPAASAFVYGHADAVPLGRSSSYIQPHLSALSGSRMLLVTPLTPVSPSDSHAAVYAAGNWRSVSRVP